MSGRQGRYSATPEMQRSSLTVQSVDLRRYSGSSGMKDFRHRQVASLHGESSTSDGKKSPGPHRTHRRSKDLNSSQESLSSPALARASIRSSAADVRESDEGSTKEGSPTHHASRSNSPDKPLTPQNTFEAPSHHPHHHHHHHRHNHSFSDSGSGLTGDASGNNSGGAGLSPYERPKSSLDSVDAARDADKERSFERSLDNILDRCCEKSLDLNLSVDSWNSSANDGGKSPDTQSQAGTSKSSKGSKKNRWYNVTLEVFNIASMTGMRAVRDSSVMLSSFINAIMSTTYKSRSEDFRKMFKEVPKEERLVVDYSCALQKDILVQGRMYISQNWICFYAKIFNWETNLMIPCKDITAITKEKTARVIPNAIQITTDKASYFFTSFGARDKTYMMLFRIWQNALLDQPMSAKEVWTWVHYNYGDDLGLTSEDDDYVAPHGFDDLTDKLREEIPAIKEPGTDSDITSLTTDPPGVNTAPSNEDTDVLSDEAFGPRQPIQHQQHQQLQNSSSRMVAATTATLTEDGGGGGEGGGGGGTTASGGGMVNGDVKVPAEFLDSSDDSDAEFFCESQDHLEKMYLDEVFNLNIDSIFECLFTDSTFFRNFVGSRKTFDLSLPDWEEELDENGNKNRNITYTLTLNNSIGPKTSPSTEKQICYAMSRPGRIYHVDCECCNGGIPYAESFYVLLRYCLTRVSKTKCRLVVTGELKYRKHVIGMFRGMIEKSAVNGLTDYCRQLSVHLRREAERQEVIIGGHQPAGAAPGGGVGPALKKKVRRKRGKLLNQSDSGAVGGTGSKTHSLERTTSTPPSPSKNAFREEKLVELNAHTLVRIIIVILVLLLLFNAVLFYKLWSLESYASSLYGIPTQESLENFAKHPRTQEEWSQLLQQQRQVYEKEINKWEEVLSVSINIVDQMKASLVQLKKSLHMGTYRHDES